MKISVVVPVYNNAPTLSKLVEQINKVHLDKFSQYDLQLVFVDDGSLDDSWEVMSKLSNDANYEFKAIKLSRNFGQVNAIIAGYDAALGDAIITISADLQDPVELMAELLKKWEAGSDIVIAHRSSRNDDRASTVYSKLAYALAKKSNPNIPSGGFDYLLLSKRAKMQICNITSRHRFFQGDVLSIGFPTAFIPYVRLEREIGSSGWTFNKKLKYFVDLILDSSYFPIRAMSFIGVLTAFIGIIYSVIILISWLLGGSPFAGWSPIMITLLVVSGMIMTMLGVIGEYIWRIYDEVRSRPQYIVESESTEWQAPSILDT
jgi:glycosyltransferase involved in cell wall biosynthesis